MRAGVVAAWVVGASLPLQQAWATACSAFPWPEITCDGRAWVTNLRSTDPRQIATYPSCTGTLAQPGPEWIMEFPCPGNTTVTVRVDNTDCDLDVYVLNGGCAPGTGCITAGVRTSWGPGNQETVTFSCTTGQSRWVVLEGFDLDQNPTRCSLSLGPPSFRFTDALIIPSCTELCSDGFDNDLDGLIDCADPNCVCGEVCDVVGDEDLDGAADCADLDCLGHPACCDVDGDGVDDATAACGGTDCDDGAASVYPGAAEVPNDRIDQNCDGGDTCWRDSDRDGWGSTVLVTSPDLFCAGHVGIANDDDDCNDALATAFPGAAEVAGDGVDQDCDGVDHCWRDADNDGYGVGAPLPGPSLGCVAAAGWAAVAGDCRDTGAGAATIHPGAAEVCDGVDNDCDLLIDGADPDVPGTTVAWPDVDGDGYGAPTGSMTVGGCGVPVGYAAQTGDCDDGDPGRSPGVGEIAHDGVDQDCSGFDLTDVDGDGVDGPSLVGLDCNDNNPLVRPGRPEVFNGADDDCDGLIDEGTARYDDDGDGWTEAGGDCDDARSDVHLGAAEVCDGVDQDCDGARDEGTTCFDDDGDGWTEDGGDCHDGDVAVHPGAVEDPSNGVDDDCDGFTDLGAVDLDGDGFASFAGDCDDEDPDVSPVAPEVSDGLDNNCNGRVDEGTDRTDDDFDAWTEVTGDCNDADAGVYPGAPEQPNGVDDDCNGLVDDAGAHGDQDRDGWTQDGGDCDDTNRDVHPYAREVDDGVDQDCDGLVDEGADDADEDGFTVEQGDCDDDDGWRNPDAEESCDRRDNDCDGAVDEDVCAPSTLDDPSGCDTAGARWSWAAALVLAWRRRGRAGARRGA